ncbi:hypothetical protein CsatB_019637 [Cannabis sativa]|uniref:SBP-type domain-containing protein n=1 Tax=Cannabis sativa TaxID=3483 RepID=A0A7J6I4H0_CANSA|nr:hypothetical protein F8388_016063 [Cannabis sativa]KAF4402492.1 hypothetical protein G4B88_012277 [Cannabis sativa]
MEMGSSSMTESGGSSSSSPPNSSTESLNGLKFGQKIYFEDVGIGATPKSGAGSSSCSGATPPKKVRGSPVHSGQPPRCQVEGCKVDLSDAKAYYSRHKVCGMHSKSPKVVVNGLEQRFCQQCSRFHQLPEFDQGKRSCRRRLAGHNERRRKPPHGSLLSTRYDNSGRVGSFLMDFSAYPRLSGRDAWPNGRISERVPGSQSAIPTGKYIPYPWQSNSDNSSSNLYLQTSGCGTSIPANHGIPPPPGECISAVADSSCALSLLSNEPWGSRNRSSSGIGLQSLMNTQGAPVAEPTSATHSETVNHFQNTSWCMKDDMDGSSSHQILPDLGLGQFSHSLTGQFSGELELSQQGRRPYMESEHSRDYGSSSQHMHWSL